MTSLYTNWYENYAKTGHFQQKHWQSHKIANFWTSVSSRWEYHEILTLIHKNLDIVLYLIKLVK